MFNIYFKNFEPTAKTRDIYFRKMKKMMSISPAKSFLCGCITKSDNKYMATINVNSYVGRFNITTSSDSERTLFEKVYQKLNTQIKKWRSVSFQGEKSMPHYRHFFDYCSIDCFGKSCPVVNSKLASDMDMITVGA